MLPNLMVLSFSVPPTIGQQSPTGIFSSTMQPSRKLPTSLGLSFMVPPNSSASELGGTMKLSPSEVGNFLDGCIVELKIPVGDCWPIVGGTEKERTIKFGSIECHHL